MLASFIGLVNRALRRSRVKRRSWITAEKGFAMVMVLVALTMLAVLGAASLLLMVTSMEGVGSKRPEERAFMIAESGLFVAHHRIVRDEVPPIQNQPVEGSMLGGDYRVWIEKTGRFDYRVVSEGRYPHRGRIFRRKIVEEVVFSGAQSFDVLRNYIIYAGNDVNVRCDEALQFLLPLRINGNIRAERDINVYNRPAVSLGDGFTVNGNLEAKRKATLVADPRFIGQINVRYYGDIRTGDKKTGARGSVELYAGGFLTRLYAATTGSRNWDIYAGNVTRRVEGGLNRIYTGNIVNQPGCEEVYVPQPNYSYYRALAQEQGNFFTGDKTLTGNLGPVGTSSVTVYYVTGNLTLQSVLYSQPNMNGIFVCEGNVYIRNNLQFQRNNKFQVIAKGNIFFDSNLTFLAGSSTTNEFFFFAGNDVTIDLRMFAGQYMQVTAMRNVNLESGRNILFDNFSTAGVMNYRSPDIDIAGFPIRLDVKSWREVPSEGAFLDKARENPLFSSLPGGGTQSLRLGWAALPERKREA